MGRGARDERINADVQLILTLTLTLALALTRTLFFVLDASWEFHVACSVRGLWLPEMGVFQSIMSPRRDITALCSLDTLLRRLIIGQGRCSLGALLDLRLVEWPVLGLSGDLPGASLSIELLPWGQQDMISLGPGWTMRMAGLRRIQVVQSNGGHDHITITDGVRWVGMHDRPAAVQTS